jgi:hypothetical protein
MRAIEARACEGRLTMLALDTRRVATAEALYRQLRGVFYERP